MMTSAPPLAWMKLLVQTTTFRTQSILNNITNAVLCAVKYSECPELMLLLHEWAGLKRLVGVTLAHLCHR